MRVRQERHVHRLSRGRPRHPHRATPALSDGRAVAPEPSTPGRFGEYSINELGDEPDAYDPRLDVDFTPPRGDETATEGFSQAA